VNLIHSLLQTDPRKRLSAVEVLGHPWLKDAKEELDVFTQKEKDVIKKEYLSKNIDRIPKKEATGGGVEETEVVFTEHNLDTRTNVGSLLKNASTKSIILAPFNSTVSEITGADEEQKAPFIWPEEIRRMIVPKRVLKFAPKVKDLDRQYEHNNNADLDNGVYNNIGNEDDPGNKISNESSLEQQDSLKRSFKETELSSDDEHAERQLEEARKQKQQEQSELEEFEKQVQRLKYTRYQEPIEVVDSELVFDLSTQHGGVYPREYLLQALSSKEMNYATALYHLGLKKRHTAAKQAAA
jgi:serine/threonine protein kinase